MCARCPHRSSYGAQIGRFGITGPAQTLAIKHLSDGLKSRVVFAWLAYRNPHMLLLDVRACLGDRACARVGTAALPRAHRCTGH